MNKQEALEQIKKLEEYIEKCDKESIVPDEWEVYSCGYYIDGDSEMCSTNACRKIDGNKNVFAFEERAEASLAMSQLSQLVWETRRRDNNWKPDWTTNDRKYVIRKTDYGKIWTPEAVNHPYPLAFRTEEIRDEFLSKHKELIEKAKIFIG
jgi:hypothetical protein